VLAGLADTGLPRIHFGVGTGELLAAMAQARRGCRGGGLANPLEVAAQRVRAARTHGPIVLQGNLGHGVLPDTNPDVLTRVVELVHLR
jgi:uroporphyrinogen decarboxylase